MREEVGVRRRVRARRAADRPLVDLDHLVEHVDPFHCGVRAGLNTSTIQPVRERLEDDLVHERRLPRAGDAGDADELPDRELDVDLLEVVLRGAAYDERAAVVVAPLGDGDLARPREELARDRLLVPLDLVGRPLGDDLAAVEAGARAHVDEPVGAPHHLLVVLDDDDGVADIAQPLERPDEARVVALVEADRRLVEDVENADELRADLRGEPEPLCLAARERRRRAIQGQIPDADVVEERQALADLLHDAVADQLLGRRELELVDELQRTRNRELRGLVDGQACDSDRKHLGLEARALADGARPEAHVLLDPLALARGVGLLVPPLEVRDDALEARELVATAAPHAVRVLDVDPLVAGAEEEEILLFLREIGPRL